MKRRVRSSVLLRNLRERIKGGVSKVERIEDGLLYRVFDGQDEIVISRLSRLDLYREGINHRIKRLVDSYCLDGLINQGDVFFDVGANIGELGVWVNSNGGEYVGVEPELIEFKALERNNAHGRLFNVGAWRNSGSLKLFSKAETADSSVIPIEGYETVVEIAVRAIDDIVESEKIKKIKVLKIETEGAEPEVLCGARGSLKMVDFVAIDCGEERGVDQNSTFLECHEILSAAGFSPFRENLKQYRLLYKRGPDR